MVEKSLSFYTLILYTPMPARLKARQEKIQAKRKQTPWREFVMEIASWYPLNFYKKWDLITTYPDTERRGQVVKASEYLNSDMQSTHYSGNFMHDFNQLYTNNPKSNVRLFGSNENSDYTDWSYGTSNCYLSFGLWNDVENWLYSFFATINCSMLLNSIYVALGSSNIFYSIDIKSSQNIFYSANIQGSSNIWFSSNLIWCSECIHCDGLVNQQYCIANVQYAKEDYLTKKISILEDKASFDQWWNVAKFNMKNIWSQDLNNCMGVNNSRNVTNGYLAFDVADSRNVVLFEWWNTWSNNFYDGIDIGIDSDNFYATCQAWTLSSHLYCFLFGWYKCYNLFYCIDMDACSYCLGCIGLKNKSYCIFNRQYTKEERYDKVDEIFTQMEKDGDLGKFFPGSMNPFYFNDTAAYLIDDTFTKEEVTAAWYLRRDEPIAVDVPEWMDVVEVADLGNYEWFDDNGDWTIDPSILKKVIRDEQWNVYRVIKMEYDFLVKYGLPLPRKHWLERLKEHFRVK